MTIPRSEQPLVNVVTPVYNGAEFIRECIESVLAQTYSNWEYIIVDNCSTDGTPDIVREYQAADPRVRLLTPNVFVDHVESGNRTLRAISPESKYTKVLHADDWIFPECLERMVALAEANPNVGVVSAYRLEETRVTLTGLPYSISVLPGRELCRSMLRGHPYPNLIGSPTSLLIRSDLVRNRDPFYSHNDLLVEGHFFTEDQAACYEILRESDFGFVHQVLTFTRRDDRSPFSLLVRLGARVPESINLLMKYGPVYLTKTEFQRKARRAFRVLLHLPARKSPESRGPRFPRIPWPRSPAAPAQGGRGRRAQRGAPAAAANARDGPAPPWIAPDSFHHVAAPASIRPPALSRQRRPPDEPGRRQARGIKVIERNRL